MNTKSDAHCSWTVVLRRLCLAALVVLAVISLVALFSSTPVSGGGPKDKPPRHRVVPGPVEPPQIPTQPQQEPTNLRLKKDKDKAGPAAAGPAAAESLAVTTAVPGQHARDPVDMKLLVISADGNETDFPAIKAFLSQIGIPYDVLIATQTPLSSSTLWDGASHGYYYGVILATGNLTYYNATVSPPRWESAFDENEWQTLWDYESEFGVRQVTSYTYPAGLPDNYGLNLITYQDTTSAPLQATLTTQGKTVFSDLQPNSPITFKNAWVYLAKVISPALTTPLLQTAQGYAIASITAYPDGRQNLAVTAANNPYLMHSLLLSYGVINWVTKGMFLGERRVNMDIQVDDLFIDDDLWDTVALTDTTGLTYRMVPNDVTVLKNWESGIRNGVNYANNLAVEFAFNGEGTTSFFNPDPLTSAIKTYKNWFNFVNHTYSHENLDNISYSQAMTEIRTNHQMANNTNSLNLGNYFKDSLVQPDISGLNNAEFLRAAKDFGLKYLISDTSRPEWNNPTPNAGFYSTYQPSILIIPRRPTNLFYNLTTPAEWVSEYNCYYSKAMTQGICGSSAWKY